MKCKHCGSEWSANPNYSASITKCPFCGESILPEEKKLNTAEEVLVEIKQSYGITILTDENKLIAFFSDLAPHLAKQRRILNMFIECGGHQKLIGTINSSEEEQFICVKQIVQEMKEEMFIEETASYMICDAFLFALTGHRSTDDSNSSLSKETAITNSVSSSSEITSELTIEQEYQNGEEYYNGTNSAPQNYQKAFEYYERAAKRGHAMAQYKSGLMNKLGKGVTKNIDKAFFYFMLSADQGEPYGIYQLGLCYLNGEGVSMDKDHAFVLIKKAAEMNIPEAQRDLGNCYFGGYGVKKDYSKAFSWYINAFDSGDVNAGLVLAKESLNEVGSFGIDFLLKYFNDKGDMTENECQLFSHAFEKYGKSKELLVSKLGYHIATKMVHYSSTFSNGFKIMNLCAERGNQRAQLWLALSYSQGVLIPQNKKLSRYWYKKAAEQN